MKEIMYFDYVETSNVSSVPNTRSRYVEDLDLVKRLLYSSIDDLLADYNKVQIQIHLGSNKSVLFDIECHDFFVLENNDLSFED